MTYPSTRVVFDRKHLASDTRRALIQIEVLYERRRKYISTGVRVYAKQFNKKTGQVCNTFEMVALNKKIAAVKAAIDDYIVGLIETSTPFTFDALDAFLTVTDEKNILFPEFMEKRIKERQDIRDSTKKSHRKTLNAIRQFGRFKTFADLTKHNIMLFDDYLHAKGIKQCSVYSYHKTLKSYIYDAMRRELLATNPYSALSFSRGEEETDKFLSEEEFDAIRTIPLPTQSMRNVRDLFVLACYTGLAYSDLMSFDVSNVEYVDGMAMLSDKRRKTGVSFSTVLLPEAMEIINRHGGMLPKMSNQQYNSRLKVLADAAGIDKPLSSHWARRTCGMLLLNKGVSMEVVAKILGHSSIKTTESVYAKVLRKTVVREVIGSLTPKDKQ